MKVNDDDNNLKNNDDVKYMTWYDMIWYDMIWCSILDIIEYNIVWYDKIISYDITNQSTAWKIFVIIIPITGQKNPNLT